ncbi:MAG: hypothetical protein UT67_C0001G0032 [Candidatus Magasanikbacteria bacterium GW2011_GWA2_40_10]|uniref:DUF4012 domain-containing protein n=1 Tax=Candidatus Magasanikbacteria bacterium GW2011_GWA2_40_10 TaxID=1619037 RepID=A0A0G0TCC2_9BACT|nr:MAG: hypothetical protein UT67_C0001G0032 [Candidatus Magasanikbacteria bacterium GW2011_GWA2_40_10]
MRRKFLLLIIILLVGATLGLYFWYRSGGLQSAVVRQVSQQITSNPSENNLIQKVLGFAKPQTYLVLFLNNTEIRPGGGFIGAYGVVKVDKGIPEILKVEGTELLDNLSPQDFPSVPPDPLQKYLPVKRWGFRDSNWSPDFAISSAKSLELFVKEKGTAANDISGVIGITPTLLEEILKISGPITVNGQLFNADNFTEKLEYEVEYGYAEQGLDFNERKKVLVDLTHALLARIRGDIFKHWPQYLDLGQRMLAEKQIIAYAKDPEVESVLLAKGWAGEIKQTVGDYILWADANLASLKTDKVMDRELSYSFAPTSSGQYVATIKMKYINKGTFTKFTTRYRTYARVFLPVGSQFVSVAGSLKNDRTTEVGAVDQGIENGKQWFGTFTSIEPGKTGELVWKFYLAPQIVMQIKNKSYNLFAQKQAGTIAHALVLDLNFGNKVYNKTTDLRLDREFQNFDF